MSFSLNLGGIIVFMLVSLRLAVIMFATPLDAFGKVPGHVRLLWTLGFGLWLTMVLNQPGTQVVDDAVSLAMAALGEVFIGAILAFGIYTAFGAFLLAGRLIDFQSGFGAATLFDPVTNEQNPLVGTLLLMLATALFFASDMHHLMVQGIAYSFQMMPVGGGLPHLNLHDVLRQFGLMFTLGTMILMLSSQV